MSQSYSNMYNHNDILIVGDSFAADRTLATDWPMALSKMLTGSDEVPLGVGKGGTAWWTVRKSIVKALAEQPPKILIVCHTDALRLPSDKDLGLNSGTVLAHEYDSRHVMHFSKEEYNAAVMYYTHLMSIDFHVWARSQWFSELDTLVNSVPIVIHLHCFPRFEGKNSGKPPETFTFKHGITSEEILFELQVQEAGSMQGTDLPGFRNHFSLENNVKIANALYRTIVNFDPAKNGTKQNLDLLDHHAK